MSKVKSVVKWRRGPCTDIFSLLRTRCRGNIHKKGVVYITASGTSEGTPEQVVDEACHRFWRSTNVVNSWITFDFREKRVSLTEYTLETTGLLQWVVSGSNDGTIYADISGRIIPRATPRETYACSGGEQYRYLRVTQTGKNENNNNMLCIRKIELYGTVQGIDEEVGIIGQLSSLYNENVHRNDVVSVTSSSMASKSSVSLHNITDRFCNDCFRSKKKHKSWIKFDFHEKVVCLARYILRCFDITSYPKKWEVAGSNDNQIWTNLDARHSNDLVDGDSISFRVGATGGRFFRYIRLLQTGKNAKSDHSLVLSEVEFFGALRGREHRLAILGNLSLQCGGNVHEKGAVTITASSPGVSIWKRLHGIVNPAHGGFWASADEPQSWIMFDFKERAVHPKHYSLVCEGNNRYVMEWELEGSDTTDVWDHLDGRCATELSDHGLHLFSCEAPHQRFYRFLRVTQTGKNGGHNDTLYICDIEFYGSIHP